jgi:hypothetical protein
MSIFGSIMDKIFHRKRPEPAAAPATPRSSTPPQSAAAKPAAAPAAATKPAAPVAPAQPVDVEEVLTELAATKGGGGNWRTSVVDLLKMLDLDSSLAARKELAEELGVHAGDHGSPEQNVALQKAVWKKLAENGGKVPASLKD